MPLTTSGPTKADLNDMLDQIAGIADGALDPECSREETVAALKDIYDLASTQEDEDADDSDDDDADDTE
jgi:hypothetical protein